MRYQFKDEVRGLDQWMGNEIDGVEERLDVNSERWKKLLLFVGTILVAFIPVVWSIVRR